MFFILLYSQFISAHAGQTALSFDLLSPILDVVKSDDESSVAALTSSQLFFLSTKDWEIISVAPCGTLQAQGLTYGDDNILYVGCSDGSISMYDEGLQTNAFTIDSGAADLHTLSVDAPPAATLDSVPRESPENTAINVDLVGQ